MHPKMLVVGEGHFGTFNNELFSLALSKFLWIWDSSFEREKIFKISLITFRKKVWKLWHQPDVSFQIYLGSLVCDSYDFLLLLLFSGTTVQPICIPHRGDKFEEGILCMASGWGKISESKRHQKNVIFLLGSFTCPLESEIFWS